MNYMIHRMAEGIDHYSYWDLIHAPGRKDRPKVDAAFSRVCLRKIIILLEQGWRWKPSLEEVGGLRREFLKLKGSYLAEFLEAVRVHNTASYAILHELIRTPTVQGSLKANHFNPDRYLKTITW